MTKFSTIHIFGFGDTQLIGSEANGSVKSSELTKLSAFIEHIKTFKPEDVTLTDYHVIHIFNNMDVRYLGRGDAHSTEQSKIKTTFSVKLNEINSSLLEEFVIELANAVVAKKAAEAAPANNI